MRGSEGHRPSGIIIFDSGGCPATLSAKKRYLARLCLPKPHHCLSPLMKEHNMKPNRLKQVRAEGRAPIGHMLLEFGTRGVAQMLEVAGVPRDVRQRLAQHG